MARNEARGAPARARLVAHLRAQVGLERRRALGLRDLQAHLRAQVGPKPASRAHARASLIAPSTTAPAATRLAAQDAGAPASGTAALAASAVASARSFGSSGTGK